LIQPSGQILGLTLTRDTVLKTTEQSSSDRFADLRLTGAQVAFLSDSAQAVLLRGANQVGKTFAGHVDLIHTARGTHPFRKVEAGPVNILVLSESWEQMGQAGGFMEKLWSLLPKDEIDPRIRFEPGRGISGKPPRIVFVKGPGRGSVITFATYRQGAARLAGSTIHAVYLDEPPPSSLYQEIVPRLLRFGGYLRIMFTPVLDMPDQTWLRELVKAGQVSEHNPWLTEANTWPKGAPFPLYSERAIERFRLSLPAAVHDMRLRGGWDPVFADRYLTAFDPDEHVFEDRPPAGAFLAVGVDHGAATGKQAAALVAIWGRETVAPVVWVLEEYVGEGITSSEDDARGILAMLARRGLGWRDVDLWVGDRPIAQSRYLVRKSNNMLRRQLAALAKVAVEDFAEIGTPEKWAGSVESGLGLINGLCATRTAAGVHLRIDPKCVRVRQFCDQFDGDPKHPTKDVGDAVRYPLERAITARASVALSARY
jgi:phage terminase large subunit-like protein